MTPLQPVTACEDPADDRILKCALEARAQVIITGDDDLLRLKRFEGIRILTPRAFLDSEMWT
jgi:predicted nucleic acid-binding protein